MTNYQSLINNFKSYLSKKKLSKKSIKNYVSDVRRFLKWLQTMKQSHSAPTSPRLREASRDKWNNETMGQWDKNQFTTYRSHLLDSKAPVKTINRHLSSLRQFGDFLVKTNLVTNNPTKGLESVKSPKSGSTLSATLSLATKEKILEEFKQALEIRRLSKKTITNYISDISQFLEFLNSRNL